MAVAGAGLRIAALMLALMLVGFLCGATVGIVTALLSLVDAPVKFDGPSLTAFLALVGGFGGVAGAVLFPLCALLARSVTVSALALFTTLGGVLGVLVCGFAHVQNVFASGDAPVVCAAVGSLLGAVMARYSKSSRVLAPRQSDAER